MRRKFVSLAKSTAVALAVLASGFALTTPASAAQPSTVTAAPASTAAGIRFTWNGDLHSGDCTLFHGASWTLNPDGTASFDGTVTSSDDNDAWLMWVHVLDRNGAELGLLGNTFPNTPDGNEFAKNLPDSSLQYRWFATGHFPANWYGLIGTLRMDYHC
ncbi:DUF6294 family protein [Amycolatopsis sp. NPDC088138]|uniref:DUF6294 family protein n=1 Tax=Amycolatopsis sp. NPDC088138 TaxID=3363938 RepID=UPI00381A4DFA